MKKLNYIASFLILSFSLTGLYVPAIALADTGVPSGSLVAIYDVGTQTLSVSGSYNNAPTKDKKQPGYALFINNNTPETSSIDSIVHILPKTESGILSDSHSLESAPEKVCLVVYDLDIVDGVPEKTSGGHSTQPAGTDRNDDNSWDKEIKNIKGKKAFLNDDCVVPEITNGENENTAVINAVKIVCPAENLLPNWGNGGPDITFTTASDFLEENPTCYTEDWTFEWAPDGTSNPGDNGEVGGGAWTAFSGSVEVPAGSLIWVREQFVDGYIPFSGDTDGNDGWNEVSAELYCHTDVLNYDNYDFINPVVAGETYHCIGFNVPTEQEVPNNTPTADAGPNQILTLPTNSTNLDGTGTDTDGTIVSYVWTQISGPTTVDPEDVEDPAISGLVAGTYVFKLTVTDDDGATGEDTVTITINPEPRGETTECSDGIDNDDPEDTLIDALDPGCHTDGDAGNPDSYNPNDDDETDEVVELPVCSDGEDNDGDELVDSADPGCHTDGDADNPDSYNPNDDAETDVVEQTSSRSRTSGGSRRIIPTPTIGEVLGAQSSCGIYVEKFLRVGYDNNVEAVVKVQTFLNSYMNAGLRVDGIYGSKTEAAVRAFQLKHADKILTPWGITASTGIFYLTTQTEVNNIMCPTLNLPIPSNLINFYPGVIN